MDRWRELVRQTSARYVAGPPNEDERLRHARAACALLLLGAGAGLALVPILPDHVDHSVAVELAIGCMVLGLLMPLLPWTRLPRRALLIPLVFVFPVIFVGGGYIDGAIDYYSLFLPLAFIYAGLVFPPRYCIWMFLCCLLGLGVALLQRQPESAVPFVLLGSVLSAVCGMVLAVQRQSETRANQAMRQLVETASSLGAARERGHVASFVAVAVAQLLNAEHVEVRLLAEGDGESTAATAGTSPDPRESVSVLIDQVVATGAPADAPEPGPTDEAGSEDGRQLMVPVRGSDGLLGVIVVSYGLRATREDRLAARHLELLCAEVTRVLERLRHTAALVEKARTDPLTGLGNRKVLDDALTESVAGDILILIDLDHFKRVNDTLGHAVGDQVLVSFAEVLRQTTRAKQIIARFGGEEFAVVLPQATVAASARLLSDVRREWSATNPMVTFSSGMAVQGHGEDAATALDRADQALYVAKSTGRDRDCQDERGSTEPAPELLLPLR
jgi:diguanylate cyclase (GGDEF)-like protein